MDAGHKAHIAHRALNGLKETKSPLAGAGCGAALAGSGASAALALAGLALTPLGWGVALAGGAAAGAAYVANKIKDK
jgi:hypothetical protein